METFWIIIAILLGIIGIAGSILPAMPGPPASWIGLLIAYFLKTGTNGAGEPMSLTFLLVWLGVTIVVSIIDYLVPIWFTKVTGGTKAAGTGAMIGLVIGMFVPPVGIIFGSLLGAFIAEYIFAKKSGWESLKSAFGAFLGFMLGTGFKVIVSGLMLYYTIVYLW